MKIFSNESLNKLLSFYEKNKNNVVLIYFLNLASIFFFIGYKLRYLLYQLNLLGTQKLNAYVVSVGNISSGGTGKTPLTIEIGKYFQSLGYKVGILCRGYMGDLSSNNEVTLVSDGKDIVADYEDVGEEAVLIARKVPQAIVIAGKKRIATGKAAINLGAEVLILDDGFQYLKLYRDKDIVLLDSYNPFDNGYLIPRGKLRELPDAIKRASCIFISNSDKVKISENNLSIIQKYLGEKPFIKTQVKIEELHGLNTKRVISIKEAKEKKFIACSGIGNPISFIDTLKRAGINIVDQINYSDHHLYESLDINNMIILAKKYNCEDIIITEKDAIKLEDICLAAPINFWYTKLNIFWDKENIFDVLFMDIKTKKYLQLKKPF